MLYYPIKIFLGLSCLIHKMYYCYILKQYIKYKIAIYSNSLVKAKAQINFPASSKIHKDRMRNNICHPINKA